MLVNPKANNEIFFVLSSSTFKSLSSNDDSWLFVLMCCELIDFREIPFFKIRTSLDFNACDVAALAI